MKKLKKILKQILWIVWRILGVCYYPIYLGFVVISIFARLILGLACFGTFEVKAGKTIIKSIVNQYGRY